MKRKNVFIQLNNSKIDSCFFYSIFVNTPFQIAYLQLNKTFRPLVRILWICSVLLLGASFLAGIIEWSRMLLISIRFISHGLSIPIDWADWSRLEMIVPAHACALRRTVPLFPCPDSFIRILHYYCCYAVRPSCSRRKKKLFSRKDKALIALSCADRTTRRVVQSNGSEIILNQAAKRKRVFSSSSRSTNSINKVAIKFE